MANGLTIGSPQLGSAGPITFGPDDVLFVADNRRAVVFAIDVGDPAPTADGAEAFDLDDLDKRLAAFLGCSPDDVTIRDLAVHPRTNNAYLAVARGHGDDTIPVIVRIDRTDGSIDEVDLREVPFAETAITDAPSEDDPRLDVQLGESPDATEMELPDGRTILLARRPARTATVTDLAYVDGTLLVAGMSNEEFSSTLRRIPFPFDGPVKANSLEIFHVSHGKWETAAPIRTLVPYEGGRSILASYTCTPLVHISVDDLSPGTKAIGRTVAELGAVNQPLDMVAFTQDDGEHLLICHSRHPVMKVSCRDIDAQKALTEPKEPTGVAFTTPDVGTIVRIDNLNGSHILALQRDEGGMHHLRSLPTATL